MTRIFFACDVHGSEIVWRKFLKMGEYHKADVIMMLGDLTGKVIVPIVKIGENKWYYAPTGKKEYIKSKEEFRKVVERYRNRGYYVYETTEEEIEKLQARPSLVDKLFTRVMTETLKSWINIVEEKVPKHVKVIICPGNDDRKEIDKVIKESDRVIYPLNTVVYLDDKHPMVSCEWVNPTPWKTPRECSEHDLKKKLIKEIERVDNYENLICNFHAPPYDSGLDNAPKLDKNLKPVLEFGAPVIIPVGSKAVREVIEKYQPLLGLHGHIHESGGFTYIGRTLCINPGSEYESGLLRGYVIDLKPEKIEFWRVEA